MSINGDEALERSQASAEAEAGSIASPSQKCLTWIGVAACYDDPWATPITECKLRIEIAGDLVADGPLTRGISGKADGQLHPDARAKLGTYRQNGVNRGPATITLGANDQSAAAKDIEKKISTELTAFETSMHSHLQPWITEWSNHGWRSVPEARLRGTLHGLGAWWEGEKDFWASVGSGIKGAWDGIKTGAGKVADWYVSLPWYEQINPVVAVEHEIGKLAAKEAKELWGGAQDLWRRREQIMNLLKAFSSGTVEAIEHALEAIIGLPGELGKLIKRLRHSPGWVQRMIEVVSETDVLKRVVETLMTVIMMMTPNFWAEGLGFVDGYLLPEVLITVVLILLGALCAAAGASALVARISRLVTGLQKVISAAGKIGKVLTSLFSKLKRIGELVVDLARALFRKIAEAAEGIAGAVNKIVRRFKKVKFTTTAEHMVSPGTIVNRGKGVTAGHLGDQLENALVGQGKVLSKTPVQGLDGVTRVEYQLYKANPDGTITSTIKQGKPFVKTVFDPSKWDEAKIGKLAQDAFGHHKAVDGPVEATKGGVTYVGWIRDGVLQSFGVK
jgi:hypothetical protein